MSISLGRSLTRFGLLLGLGYLGDGEAASSVQRRHCRVVQILDLIGKSLNLSSTGPLPEGPVQHFF